MNWQQIKFFSFPATDAFIFLSADCIWWTSDGKNGVFHIFQSTITSKPELLEVKKIVFNESQFPIMCHSLSFLNHIVEREQKPRHHWAQSGDKSLDFLCHPWVWRVGWCKRCKTRDEREQVKKRGGVEGWGGEGEGCLIVRGAWTGAKGARSKEEAVKEQLSSWVSILGKTEDGEEPASAVLKLRSSIVRYVTSPRLPPLITFLLSSPWSRSSSRGGLSSGVCLLRPWKVQGCFFSSRLLCVKLEDTKCLWSDEAKWDVIYKNVRGISAEAASLTFENCLHSLQTLWVLEQHDLSLQRTVKELFCSHNWYRWCFCSICAFKWHLNWSEN